MIIGINDKYMVRELKKRVAAQDNLIADLHEKIDGLIKINKKEDIDFLNAQIKDYKEREEELLTIIKAIISKFGKGEIVISHEAMLSAKDLRLIKQREFMSNSNIYRIVREKEILDSHKEE